MTRGTLLLALLWAVSACGPGVSRGFDPADAGTGTPAGPRPVRNPVPAVTFVLPEFVDVEGREVRIRVEGQGFTASSTLYWREQALPTTFVSSRLLETVLQRVGTEDQAWWHEARLTVHTPEPGGGTSKPVSLRFPGPILESVTPDELLAESEGTVRLTLTGRNFVQGGKVTFRGAEYPTTVLSTTQAEAELPGSVLTAREPPADGGMDSLSSLSFRSMVNPSEAVHSNGHPLRLRNPVPQIEGVIPQVLSATRAGDGGTPQPLDHTVRIQGRNLTSNMVVKWNGQPLEQQLRPWQGSVSITLPPEARASPGTVSLTLEAPGPGGGESAPFPLVLVDGPVLQRVTPQRMGLGVGDVPLEVWGEGFDTGSVVHWDGMPLPTWANESSDWAGNSLKASLPANMERRRGTHRITVVRGRDGHVSDALLIEVGDAAPAPVSVALEPAVLTVGDTPVRLTVRGTFSQNSFIRIDGEPRTTLWESGEQLSTLLEVPDLLEAGVRTVTVSTPGPGGGTSLPLLLKVDERRKVPLLTGMAPQSAAAGSGLVTLQLTGHGFGPYSVVRWNGEALTTRWREGCCNPEDRLRYHLEADVPSSRLAQAGTARVTVFNPAPGGGMSAALGFAIAEQGSPFLGFFQAFYSSIEVGSPETFVELSGYGFTSETRVLVDGEPRVPVYQSDSRLTLALGAEDLAVTRTLELRTHTPGFALSRPVLFTVLPVRPPHLSSLSPGVVSVGTWVAGQQSELLAGGVGLAPKDHASREGAVASTLEWGGASHQLWYTFGPYYSLRAALPGADVATAAGPHEVSVSRAAEGGSVSLPALLNVVAERPVPYLFSVMPASVRAGTPGLRLQLSGTAFHSASVVRWNGQPLPTRLGYRYGMWTLEAVVPASLLTTPGQGQVTVETPAPGGGTSLPIPVSVQ